MNLYIKVQTASTLNPTILSIGVASDTRIGFYAEVSRKTAERCSCTEWTKQHVVTQLGKMGSVVADVEHQFQQWFSLLKCATDIYVPDQHTADLVETMLLRMCSTLVDRQIMRQSITFHVIGNLSDVETTLAEQSFMRWRDISGEHALVAAHAIKTIVTSRKLHEDIA